ncbi:hypothetical protein TNCV_2686181 [Trichonephila clavipes]|nr:hypothetical protein TNCV_2686181 [Trichonephila clavipes]
MPVIGMMKTGWSARTSLTDQSSRRHPHRKKCTRTANCFIDCHSGTGSTFTRVHVSSRTIRSHLAEGDLESMHPLRVLPLKPEFRVVPCSKKLDCSGIEPATRGLLVTDLVILNQGQVMTTTPELAVPSPNYHTNGLDKELQRASLPCTASLQWFWARTRDKPATFRYLAH